MADERPDMPHNPTAVMLTQGMRHLLEAMRGVRDTLERRESRSPGHFPIWPGSFRTQPQLRVDSITVASIAAFSCGIRIGTEVRFKFQIAANAVQTLTVPIVIMRGETITVIDNATGNEASAAQVLDAWLFAFSDAPSSKESKQ